MKKKIAALLNLLKQSGTSELEVSHLHKWNNLRTAISFVVANNIEGDYLEFGVYQGASFIYTYKLFNQTFDRYKGNQDIKSKNSFLEQDIRFFAFDSFEGLPENDDQDIPLHWTGEKPMSYPRYLFEENLKTSEVNLDRVTITEGYYDQTLNPKLYKEIDLKKAAIIHIDCDLYESTKTVLNTIKPLIVEGTVVVFDDYFYYKGSPYKGERGAFNEWLQENKNFVVSELSKYYPGAAFILNSKDETKNYDQIV